MKLYPVGLVGESHYRTNIESCYAGMRVYVCHEPDNPHDDMALRVETSGGQTIGYVPRKSWLRSAVHEEGRGVTCTIASLNAVAHGHIGVVIDVTLTDDDVPIRSYMPAPPDQQSGVNAA